MASQKTVKLLFALLVLGNVLFAAVILLGGIKPSTPTKSVMPNPNGFDNFVQATHILPTASYSEFNDLSVDQLRTLVSNATPALNILRQGLTNESRFPDDYSVDYIQKYMSTIISFRQMGQALVAEGRLAELEGRANEAAQAYLNTIHFGQKSSQGGVMVYKGVGTAIEALGRDHLCRLINSVDAQHSRQIARSLEMVDSQEPPVDENLRQEKIWSLKTTRLIDRLKDLWNYKEQNAIKSNFVARVHSTQLRRRQTILDFATRAYELDHGKLPQSPSDLVTNYVIAIPRDPITGTNLSIPTSTR
ncbi:hypothetical protein [Pedosphaera parvula]|nr:hypothetical protein [Pedosphaera parvula]